MAQGSWFNLFTSRLRRFLAMNPTAEDILNKNAIANGYASFADALAFGNPHYLPLIITASMEEYSLLKSKEAADKAWEASYTATCYAMLPDSKPAPNKETFMKELFKPVTI